MLDLALKDIRGHKVRSLLTVLGIVLAIAAIVSLGSISSGLNEMVQGQMELAGSVITLEEAGGVNIGQGPPSGKLAIEDLEEIRGFDGVEEVSPMFMQQSEGTFFIGVMFDRMELMDLGNIEFEEGGWPEEGEYKVAIGSFVAENKDLNMGDTLVLEDEELEICGILEQLQTFMDYGAITSLDVMQNILDEREHVTVAYLKPQDVSDIDSITDEVEKEFPDIEANSMKENAERAEESISQMRVLTMGVGFVASIVAAIGIINTMFMSISERKRQIGILKAVGAFERQIVQEVLEEGILLSIIGGSLGLLFGYLGTQSLNTAMGMPMAKVTPGLAVFSVSFGVILTLVASLYPAIKASRFDPIESIKGL